MAGTYVTDLRHYVDEATGDLAEMPGPALNLAMFLASIVAWVTAQESAIVLTNVWCFRKPSQKRCRGEIMAELQGPDIIWHCPRCGVNGVIRGWEDSAWDQCGSAN